MRLSRAGRRPLLLVRYNPDSKIGHRRILAVLIALGRKSWLFCGSDRGGQRAAAMYSLIVTCKMNRVDPQAWLTDVLSRIAAHPAHRLDELLPWKWKARVAVIPAQAA